MNKKTSFVKARFVSGKNQVAHHCREKSPNLEPSQFLSAIVAITAKDIHDVLAGRAISREAAKHIADWIGKSLTKLFKDVEEEKTPTRVIVQSWNPWCSHSLPVRCVQWRDFFYQCICIDLLYKIVIRFLHQNKITYVKQYLYACVTL
jgi:hypothetical protein